MANLDRTTINDNGFLRLPVGSNSQRPSSVETGMLRFNSEINQPEIFNGTDWIPAIPPDIFVRGTKYFWYDTQSLYNSVSHPQSESEFNDFFDTSVSGVSFGGSGDYDNIIFWGSSNQSAGGFGSTQNKPSYLPAEGYSWKIEGFIYAPTSGTYRFAVDGDDAVDIFVNDQLVCYWYDGHGFDNSLSGGPGVNPGSITLQGDSYYPFKARMEEGGGGDGIACFWEVPGQSFQIIPPENLFRLPQ